MPVLHQLQPSFNNGEISPLLYDRVDFKKFVSSVKSGKNMFVHPQGGMSNRAGTVMLAQAKQATVRLIPFEFSSTETYVIEFGNNYCRFYTADGQVVYNNAPYEIVSPFTTADLFNIRYCQTGDVMYIAWGGKPKCLIREGHTNWHFEDYDYKNGPFGLQNSDKNKHLSVGFDSDENKYEISSDSFQFSNTDIGRLVEIEQTIQGFHSSGVVNTSSGSYTSNIKLVTGNYEFHTRGTWSGNIKIEYSKDKNNWLSEREFSGASDINFDYSGVFEEGLWWCRITASVTNGELTYTFDTQTVPYNLVFKVTNFVSSQKVYASYMGDIVDLKDLFVSSGAGGEIQDVIPVMTSNTTPSGTAYSTTFSTNAWKFFAFPGPSAVNLIVAGDSGSFGYKPSSAFYVNKVQLTVFWMINDSPYRRHFSHLSELFDVFKISYSLDNSTKQVVQYYDTVVNSPGNYANYVTLDLGGYYLLDDLFIEYTVKNLSYSQIRQVTIEGVKAKGILYVPGETNISVTDKYSVGTWSDSTYYPQEVDLYQDRIVWATNNQLDATKISDYENFGVSTDVTEDEAISVIVKDKKVDKINSIVSGTKLAVYSDDGNFVHNNDTFTPNSATFLKQGATGGSEVKPVVVRDHIIYAHPMKQAISDYAYNFETDGYAGQDITLLAHHLFNGKVIKTLAYQQEPYSIIWVLQEEGTVLACTYLRQQDVIAWTPMDFGGEVTSIAVCSSGVNEYLYLSVKRANGTFVERMPTRLLSSDPKECFFVDCGRTYRGTAANIISGLSHLNGQQVVALADGNVVKDLTVSNGSITLPYPASIVHVGLPYESVLETLMFDANTGDGSNLNRKKRVVAVSVRYNNSRSSRISVNGHRETDMLKREQEGYNVPISLKSGFYREILASTHNEATAVKIRQTDPLPLTVVSIIPEIEYEK